jgi:surfeit locus 1 family protein
VFKKLVTLVILIGTFCTLVFLGHWQLQRLEWKQAILDDIAKQESIDPMTKPLDLDKDTAEFQRGFITGDFLMVAPIRLGPRTMEGQVGYHVLMPYRLFDGRAVMVNMGWVVNDANSNITMPSSGNRIAGYLKTPDAPGQFTPQNNPEQNLFYSADIDAFNTYYDLELYPKILYMEFPSSENPKTFEGLLKPRNNHAQYAAFWFGMAGLLVLLSGFAYWRQRRQAS